MPRRVRRMPGKLIQKSKEHNQKKYYVIAKSNDNKESWDVDTFSSLDEAISYVDNNTTPTISYYVHTDSNRVLYYK